MTTAKAAHHTEARSDEPPHDRRRISTTVRYFAAAAAAAESEEERLDLPAGSSIGDLLAECGRRHGPELQRVLDRSSYLLDAVAVHDRDVVLIGQQTVDVLPPFAGG